MNTEPFDRWPRIEAVLTAALEATPAERASVLDRLCAGDRDLRSEVESLLDSHDRADGFLADAAGDFAAPFLTQFSDASPSGDAAGAIVGRYRLLHELGRGGMGTVWLAERADGQFQQRVALKLIRRGMDSDEIQARFLRERQILARLEHPNIARLLDGGVSDDGRPYFVMEYIRGVPLTRSCEDRALAIEARLRLFVTVCRAVQFAHRNLVVHRDIKPSNVLVTENGDVTLLDFGVAKLLSEDGPGDRTLTAHAKRGPLTPEYASPEQLAGQPVTTATDVYQLGVLLYELLTGHRPARGGQDAEPMRPSAVATHDRLRRRLRGDLDAIALRALAQEPEERQPSADAIAEDIERHLAFLPVRYGRAGWTSVLGKFLRRHRLKVAAVVVLASVSAALGSLYVSRIREERDRARREVAKSSEITAAIRRVFRGWSPDEADHGTVSAEKLLTDAVRRVRLELAAEPEVLAATLSMLGDMHSAVGYRALAESVLTEALSIQRQLPSVSKTNLAATLSRKGWLLQESGRLEEAEPLLREALAHFRQLPGEEGREANEAGLGLAFVLRQRHSLVEAETLYREILERVPVQQPVLKSEVSTELGYVLFMQARYSEAVALLRPSLDTQRRLLGPVHKSTLRTTRSLGASLRGPEVIDEAEALARAALDAARTLYGESQPEAMAAKGALAVVLERKGDFAAAEPVARTAVPGAGRVYDMAEQGGLMLRTLGSIRLALGDLAGAETALRSALTELRKILPGGHPDDGDALNRLAFVLQMNRAPDADTFYERAAAFDRARPSNGNFFLTDGYEYLAWAARRRGDLAFAETLYRRALTVYEKELPIGHLYRAQSAVGLGETLIAAGRHAEAEPYLREGLRQWQATRPPATDRVAEVVRILEKVLFR